MRMMGGRQAG